MLDVKRALPVVMFPMYIIGTYLLTKLLVTILIEIFDLLKICFRAMRN